MTVQSKPSRLEARVKPEVYDLLKRAAALEGRSLTDFVVAAASAAATKSITDREVVRLSGESARFVAEMLLDPNPPIVPAMLKAKEHAERLFGPL